MKIRQTQKKKLLSKIIIYYIFIIIHISDKIKLNSIIIQEKQQ